MEMPKYYNLVKIVAQLTAVLGCVAGSFIIIGGLAAFRFGAAMGFSAIAGGIGLVIGSLTWLGVAYCFLAMVTAQIDIRNAVVKNTLSTNQEPHL